MRSEEQERTAVRYIEANPAKAKVGGPSRSAGFQHGAAVLNQAGTRRAGGRRSISRPSPVFKSVP